MRYNYRAADLIKMIVIIIMIIIILLLLLLLLLLITTTTIILIMMIIIIIALKGAVCHFDSVLTALQTVSNIYAQVSKVQSCANTVQHQMRIMYKYCATSGAIMCK